MSGMASEEAILTAFREFFGGDNQAYLVSIKSSSERYPISVTTIEADTAIEAYIKALDEYTPDQIVSVTPKKHD